MRNLALLRRLNTTVRTGLLAGAVVITRPLQAETPADLQTVMTQATAGDVESQHALGNAYANGTGGVSQDYAEALKWYRRAADKGYAPAQFSYGLACELGRGIAADARLAFKYYLLAAEQSYAPAQFSVGNMYASGRGVGQDFFEANLWFRQAADAGVVEAQFNLGFAYEAGNGVKKDESQAARWYRLAAERGYPRAQYNLGLLLEDGRGLPKDTAAAATLYRTAAEQGFAPAQVNYGLMLSEGRAGGPADPVQAYVWLSRAAKAGVGSEALDALARTLTGEQLATAQGLAGTTAPTARPPAEGGNVTDQLREQNRRLAAQVDSLRSAKEAADRQAEVLSRQLNELQQGRDAGAHAGDAGTPALVIANLQRDNARLNDEVKRATRELLSLNSQLRSLRSQTPKTTSVEGDNNAEAQAKSAADLRQLQDQTSRLEAENRRLVERVAELDKEAKAAAGAAQVEAELRHELNTLRKEKSDAEQWAQSLEKTLNEKSASAAPAENALAALKQKQTQLELQIRERDQSLERQTAAAERLATENKDLVEQIVRADQLLKTLSGGKAGAKDASALQQRLAEAQTDAVTVKDLTAQADGLRRSLAATEQELAALRSTRAQTTTEQANLRAELTSLRTELAESGRNTTQLTATVNDLRRARAALQDQLAAGQGDTTNVAALRDSLVQANAKVADLQRELAAARLPAASSTAGAEELKQQLAEANQALEKSGTTVAELTAANDKLAHDLEVARRAATDSKASDEELAKLRQGAGQLAALREENGKLRKDLAETTALRAKNDQLTKDNEQLTAFMNGNRTDLEKAQARVGELEKQLADALTVRTRGGDDSRKQQAELAEANQSVEKLNATVAELTAANEKLEKDLENAQKSTAAALAAQSQAVNAASPDAFQMEISTLNSRIKQLEAQVEEERSGAAREIATVVSQLQRTRETNKSLTEANRALLSAKENDTSTVRDDIAQLEGKVRELTATNEDLRRTNQKQASDLRGLTTEREGLKSELVDVRKAVALLPGMADEKAALQERLETVGTQLVQLQREHDELQKTNADLSAQLTASRQAAEKAQGELATVQTQSAEAEKAAEAHNTSVAELTQANTRLETEREDMRRLVESYRGDIARLTQAARAAEQQKTEAERSGQQNVDAVTAQMAQLRRELDVARANHARLAEAYATQERERSGTIAQLRAENAAQAARLNQAQGTLDQIAAAARLGTPAATIASGGIAPARPAPTPTAEPRMHTVAEGDSLSRISMRYYGTSNRWQEIFQANRDVLQGSSALRVGMQLRIP